MGICGKANAVTITKFEVYESWIELSTMTPVMVKVLVYGIGFSAGNGSTRLITLDV